MSLIPVAIALAALFFASALGSPVTLTFVNNCGQELNIGLDPAVAGASKKSSAINDLAVPTGSPKKPPTLSIPEGWKGAIWPKLNDEEVTIDNKKQKIGNTRLFLDNQKYGLSYYLDVDYGFSYSVNITPIGTKETLDVGEKVCESLHFQMFKCPNEEPLPDENTKVDLTLNPDKQCMSPCAQIHKAAGSDPPDGDLVKNFCCPDIENECKAKDSQYLKSLRESGSRLNSNDYDKEAIDASCKSTKFTVTVSCTKDLTVARFFHPTKGRMLFYEYYYKKNA